MRIYKYDEIQKVYERHAFYPNSVVYSADGGYTWRSVPMDSGKWVTGINGWMFAFIELEEE